jgi:hypothetical protein
MSLITKVVILAISIALTSLIIKFNPDQRPLTLVGHVVALNLAGHFLWSTILFPIFFSPLRHIPGPKKGNFLLGHAIQARLSTPRGELARRWMEEIPNEGLLRFRDLFNTEALIPTSHAMLKTILIDNNYDYTKQTRTVDILRPVLGDGLILVEGDLHKFQRKRKSQRIEPARRMLQLTVKTSNHHFRGT